MNFPWLVVGVLGISVAALPVARTTGRYAATAIIASAAILLLQYFYFRYTSDDAYISYRYARNLTDGDGLVWNPGAHVEGYTNFLWVVILAGAHDFCADIVVSGRWLGFGLAITAAAGTYALARDLVDDNDLAPHAGLAAALLLAASGAWSLWATAGLEAPLFATLMLAAVLLHIRERDRGTPPISGAIWALVAMTRPDGVLLFAVSGVFKLADVVSRARSGGRRMGVLGDVVRLIVWAAGFAAVFVPYFWWRYATYGWLYPNTYYAKVGSGIDQYNRGLEYALSFASQYGGWLLLLVPLALVTPRLRHAAGAYVAALVVAWFAYTAYVGGDSLLLFRFVAPVLPLFYAIVVASAAAIIASLRDDARINRRSLGVAAMILAAAAIAFTLHPSVTDALNIAGERHAVDDRADIGRWLRGNVAGTTTIAAVPVGAIGYESQLPVIDMLGINDEHIAHRDIKIGDFAAGHEKYDSAYVLDQQPDIIILFDDLSPRPLTGEDYAGLNRVFIPAVVDMLNNPRLAAEYDRRVVQVREDKWFNLLVRHGASDALAKTQPAPP